MGGLTLWLTDCLSDCLSDWLTDCLSEGPFLTAVWLFSWLFFSYITDWFPCALTVTYFNPTGWLAGLLAVSQIVRLLDLLTDPTVDQAADPTPLSGQQSVTLDLSSGLRLVPSDELLRCRSWPWISPSPGRVLLFLLFFPFSYFIYLTIHNASRFLSYLQTVAHYIFSTEWKSTLKTGHSLVQTLRHQVYFAADFFFFTLWWDAVFPSVCLFFKS